MKRLRFRPKSVIFDMDGVIIDSMPYHFLAWYEAMRPLGIRVSCLDVYSKEGERWEKTLKDFLRRRNIKPAKEMLDEVFAARQVLFRKDYRGVVFKGAKELLVCLKQKRYLLGLVTGTPTRELRRVLPAAIRKLFDCIVAGDTVKRGKPAPDPYLRAAKTLRIEPSQCLVIENAPLGVESAKKAGMFCIALTTSLPKAYLRRADIIADRLEDVSGIIDKACSL